jgi:hypothetical protein
MNENMVWDSSVEYGRSVGLADAATNTSAAYSPDNIVDPPSFSFNKVKKKLTKKTCDICGSQYPRQYYKWVDAGGYCSVNCLYISGDTPMDNYNYQNANKWEVEAMKWLFEDTVEENKDEYEGGITIIRDTQHED